MKLPELLPENQAILDAYLEANPMQRQMVFKRGWRDNHWLVTVDGVTVIDSRPFFVKEAWFMEPGESHDYELLTEDDFQRIKRRLDEENRPISLETLRCFIYGELPRQGVP